MLVSHTHHISFFRHQTYGVKYVTSYLCFILSKWLIQNFVTNTIFMRRHATWHNLSCIATKINLFSCLNFLTSLFFVVVVTRCSLKSDRNSEDNNISCEYEKAKEGQYLTSFWAQTCSAFRITYRNIYGDLSHHTCALFNHLHVLHQLLLFLFFFCIYAKAGSQKGQKQKIQHQISNHDLFRI